MRVTFLNPSSDSDPFYKAMVQLARLAAADLSVDFAVLDANRDLEQMRTQAKELVESDTRPDYVVLVNDRDICATLLPELSQAGIKTFLICEGFFIAEKILLGEPRKLHPNWLGGLLPNDEQAGATLAEILITKARERGLATDAGSVHVIGLSGAYSTGSILRMNGLRKAVDRHPDVVLREVAPALWERDMAEYHTRQMLSRHSDAAVIWAADDNMALGAADAAQRAGRTPGSDILLGGIDWAPFAFEKVDSGVFAASLGGPVLDCAWAIVMLFDYHHGHDFGASLALSDYGVMTKENCSRYRIFFDESRWQNIKFSAFSRQESGDSSAYDFSVEEVISQL